MATKSQINAIELSKSYKWSEPQNAIGDCESRNITEDVLTHEQVLQWRHKGYVLVNNVLPETIINGARQELSKQFPPPQSVDDGQKRAENVGRLISYSNVTFITVRLWQRRRV